MPFEGVKAGPPPRKDAQSRPAVKRQSGKLAAREEAAGGILQILGYGCVLVGWHADAGAIGQHGPGLAHELAVVAETDSNLAKGLDSLLQVGPYGTLIVAAMPLALQVMANHGILKPEAFAAAGVVSPAALSADVKATLAEQSRQALLRQRDAEKRLRETHENLEAERMAANGSQAQGEPVSA